MDAVLVEGATADSLFPTSERCKEFVAAHSGPATPLNRPVVDMMRTLKGLREVPCGAERSRPRRATDARPDDLRRPRRPLRAGRADPRRPGRRLAPGRPARRVTTPPSTATTARPGPAAPAVVGGSTFFSS